MHRSVAFAVPLHCSISELPGALLRGASPALWGSLSPEVDEKSNKAMHRPLGFSALYTYGLFKPHVHPMRWALL